ncbi:MAG: hypothetical protein WBA67_17880 [Jannaschia sp.]
MIDTRTPASNSPVHAPGSIGWLKALARAMTGESVISIYAPGGKDRRSVRLELSSGRTVIATRRENLDRAEHEAAILSVLHQSGAPVPEVIGFRDGLLLQSDAGRNRLSFAMTEADAATRDRLARKAIEALETCRAAVEAQPDLLASLPGLGTRPGWAEELVSRAIFLSGDLRIATPRIDADVVAQALSQPPVRFTRWDARLGNAAVQADGSVIWFDWDLFGRRAGVEDVSWLIADNYWPLDRDATEVLLAEAIPDNALRRLAVRMAVVIAIGRLSKIRERVALNGWADAVVTLREDRVGAVPSVVTDLCRRMSDLTADDPVQAGLSRWFLDAGAAITAMSPEKA